jgi:hypothetical protein
MMKQDEHYNIFMSDKLMAQYLKRREETQNQMNYSVTYVTFRITELKNEITVSRQ